MTRTSLGKVLALCLVAPLIQPADLQAESATGKTKIFNAHPYANVDILVSGKYHTIVPKGSIINLPDRHKSRLSSQPVGDYVPFKKFASMNYAWISAQEVTLERVKGQEDFSEATLKSMQQSGRVIIATYKGNSISVQTPKESSIKK